MNDRIIMLCLARRFLSDFTQRERDCIATFVDGLVFHCFSYCHRSYVMFLALRQKSIKSKSLIDPRPNYNAITEFPIEDSRPINAKSEESDHLVDFVCLGPSSRLSVGRDTRNLSAELHLLVCM